MTFSNTPFFSLSCLFNCLSLERIPYVTQYQYQLQFAHSFYNQLHVKIMHISANQY
jgi:hypothetical protein